MPDTFVCHDIEWFKGDKCLECEKESQALDNDIEALGERIDLEITGLRVLREQIEALSAKLDALAEQAKDL